MKALRFICPLIQNGTGAVLFPYGYDGDIYSKLQKRVDCGSWILGYKPNLPLNHEECTTMMMQLDIDVQLTWISNVEWLSPRVCVFRDNAGSWQPQLEFMCNMLKGWYLYKPYTTWERL